jgi:REP element-mobilizing transposase RayT
MSTTGIYHVLIRGINRQRLFEDDEDCLRFLEILGELKEVSGLKLLAWCLMGNHIHLLIETGDEELGQTMKRLGVRYVSWFNMKYARTGHLFQDRYRSEPVESDAYFFTVLCYIFQNPLKAGLSKTTEGYRWSSRSRLGKSDNLIDGERLKELCDIDDVKRREYETAGETILNADVCSRVRKTDAEARDSMNASSGASNASAFQSLERVAQRSTVLRMRKEGFSVRQMARVTGLSKGLIESWGRRAAKADER